jgi:hypothetical protein
MDILNYKTVFNPLRADVNIKHTCKCHFLLNEEHSFDNNSNWLRRIGK